MKTKYTIKAFLPILLSIPLLIILILILPKMLNEPFYEGKVFPVLFLPLMFGFAFVYLVFGEIRNKFISINVDKKGILKKKFFWIILKIL